MRKLFRIGIVLVIIGTVSGVASAKTLFVAEENEISNSTPISPADALSVDVKLTTYNNQCMVLTFSAMAAVGGPTAPLAMSILPKIDETPPVPTENGGGSVYFTGAYDSSFTMVGYTWYKCGLNIGRHTIAIRYYPNGLGNTAWLGARILKIDIKSGKIVPPLVGAELEDE
jgi:hypothetical protein